MRRAVSIKEGTQRAHDFRYRPADPIWASASHLADVRRRISAFDPRVALWWGGNRGRWRLMEWLNGQGIWSMVCYWEGPSGEYRVPEATGIIAKLASIAQRMDKLGEQLEAAREKAIAASRKELRDACLEHAKDRLERVVGIRQTFGQGRIRSRNPLAGEAESQHRKFVSEHLKRDWELRNGRVWEGPGS